MPDPLFQADDEANTPLTPEEREQLIPSYITLRHELNEAEQVNIGQALRWATSRKRDVLDPDLLSTLHARMFGDVWRWAGQYRTTAPQHRRRRLPDPDGGAAGGRRCSISDRTRDLSAGTKSPCASAIAWSPTIPFRTAMDASPRLVGDLLARRLGRPPFSWGRADLVDAGETPRPLRRSPPSGRRPMTFGPPPPLRPLLSEEGGRPPDPASPTGTRRIPANRLPGSMPPAAPRDPAETSDRLLLGEKTRRQDAEGLDGLGKDGARLVTRRHPQRGVQRRAVEKTRRRLVVERAS